jgi:hypothetical protein
MRNEHLSKNLNLDKLRENLDDLLSGHEETGIAGASAESEAYAISEWLKQNPRIVKLTELIPKAKRAEGELAYITKGQYRKHWGREPKPGILTPDGKRVRWEYALDELAHDLGLEGQYGSQADEALKNMIEMAVEYKHQLRELGTEADNSEDTYDKERQAIENLTINIGRREQTIDMQDARSEHAKQIDNSLQAHRVLAFPNVVKWLDSPNRYDVRGIDTKRQEKHKVAKNRIRRSHTPTITGMKR